MLPSLDPRYRVTEILGHHEERLVCAAEDRLTGRSTVLKTGAPAQMLHELATLLTLPPKVAPEVLDAVWTADGRVILVLERLRGSTLLEAASTLRQGSIPDLVLAISQALVHLHRAGVIHVDLKPSNVFLLDSQPGRPEVRLLDFGFAHRASGSRFPDEEEQRGGTLPYLAPEVQRGWAFDGRADLFSLGVTVRDAFPQLMAEPDWSTILTRLPDPYPSRRFPDALALRAEVAERFHLPPRDDRFPRIGGGPMRGREREMAQLLEQVQTHPPGARILLCARPGTGLSRFMLEGLMAIARAQGPATRLLDVRAGADMNVTRALEFLQERVGAAETVLCGVADISPGLHWLDPEMGTALRRSFACNCRQRIVLQPLDADVFIEATARALGSGGATVERVGEDLCQRTEGSFRAAADGLHTALRHCDCDERGSVDIEQLFSELSSWSPPDPDPAFDRVPADLHPPLRLCARAGQSFARSLAAGLLARFLNLEALDALLDHGLLQKERAGRLAFVTRHLRRVALAEPLPNEREVLAWLNEQSDPDPERPEVVLEACARARRLGDREREARLLSQALAHAHRGRRWSDLRRLLDHPEAQPRWSLTLLHARLDELHRLLAGTWPRTRLTLAAAEAFLDVDSTIAQPLLEEVAAGSSSEAAEALVLLLGRDISQRRDESYARHMRTLESLEREDRGPQPGVVDRIRARRDQTLGRFAEAELTARRALRALEGSGTLQENLARQLLATLRFDKSSSESIAFMRSALDASRDREQVAQAAQNLALMLAQTGEPEAAVRAAERGIAALEGRGRSNRLILLRARRAWSLANLDCAAEALREAQDLLELAAVQQNSAQRVLLRLLAGYCHLHQGAGRAAIAETARAWGEARNDCALELQFDALAYLIDALLDLEAWDLVRMEGASLQIEGAPARRRGRLIAARSRALCVQADEHWETAVEILAELEAEARDQSMRVNVARYLHHSAVARLAASQRSGGRPQAEKAAQLLEEAISILEGSAYGYYRGRSLLVLSMALDAAGDFERARRIMNESIGLARRLGCRGLQADALQLRARMDLSRESDSVK